MNNLLNEKRSFTEYLEERGLFIDSKGGAASMDATSGKVNRLQPGSYKLCLESGSNILCFTSEVFSKTIKDVEEKLNYQLFGNQ